MSWPTDSYGGESSRTEVIPHGLVHPRQPRGRSAAAGGPLGPGESTRPTIDLRKIARILRERWRVVAGTFVIVTGGVAAASLSQDPVYRATGSIEIRKQAAEVVPVAALFQTERISDQYLQTQYGVLRSPALVRRALADSTLAARLAGDDESELVRADQRLDALVERVNRNLSVSPVTGSRIVRVSYQAADPVVAADLLNVLITHYIAMREEAGTAALARLAEQADSVRASVLRAESALQQFVHERGLTVVVGVAGETETVPHDRLRRLQQELTEAETDGYRAEAAYHAAREQAGGSLESDLLKSLRVRIAELQGEHARLSSTFTDSFPRVRQLRRELAQLDTIVTEEQRRVSSAMSTHHQAALRRRTLLRDAVNEQRVVLDRVAASFAEYERRKRDLDGQRQLYAVLQQKRKESAVSAALSSMDVAVLDSAVAPVKPVLPSPKRDVPLGALAGIMLGLGLAFLRDATDTSLRNVDEIDNLFDTRVLALIPSVRTLPRIDVSAVPADSTPPTAGWSDTSSVAEAFRGLRTSVLYETVGPLPRTLLITSTAPGEGKTFVSTNLAISLSMLGRRVLLVDADLRRPTLHRVFGIRGREGLATHLAGDIPWRQALCRSAVPNLDILPSGRHSHNPSDLLSSGRIRALLVDAQSSYDFVIVDAPALFINAPDARILAQVADGVLLVVRSGTTPRDSIRRLLEQTPNLVGVVLNGVDLGKLPSYYQDYGTGRARSYQPA